MEEKEQKMQELYLEYQSLEQQIRQLQNQLESLTQQMLELSSTSSSLDEFKSVQAGKEVFVPLSSGIFAKATIQDTSELLVNVGANVVVKKDVQSTKKLLQNQVEEIRKVQKRMISELEAMASRAAKLETELQNLAGQQQ